MIFRIHRLSRYMEITMFDRLVESSRPKQERRAGRYLLVTSLIYAVALAAFTSLAVMGFNPALAENLFLVSKLPPPPALSSQPLKEASQEKPNALTITSGPKKLPGTFASLSNFANNKIFDPNDGDILPNTGPGISRQGLDLAPPEPPALQPPPARKIEPAPEVKPTSRVSERVLQGLAIRKVKPAYPVLAKQVHASGPVQVQVTIAEDGRVTEAYVIGGPALLRSAALEASRQWIFSPTTIGKIPVKVQGILTFNFVLE